MRCVWSIGGQLLISVPFFLTEDKLWTQWFKTMTAKGVISEHGISLGEYL